ncbi:periplasmic binding protein domain-containing protein [Chytridium lagenaria]|nr:periplasmic binding protein domain-containing protein [Chytridium lagenaria]
MGRLRALLGLIACILASGVVAQNDVYVGILHSQTGTLAISEISVIQAELLAIDEINAAGGVLGKRIVPVIRDGGSDAATFAREAQILVSNSSIINVFWQLNPFLKPAKIMLWYPVQYEGQECSSSIIYSGAAPNQQLEPAVRWLLNTYPKYPFFLLGSDYVFPRTANAIIKAMLNTLGRPNVAERYCVLPRNEADRAANALVLDRVIEDMKRLMPDGGIVFNTLNGDANVDFFTKLNNSGLRPDKYPTLSVSITETEVSEIGVSKARRPFRVITFGKKYNDSSLLLNDPMEAAYINVYMWALAAEKAQTFAADKVRLAAYNMRFDAPEGTVVLRSNHHLAKFVRIGRLANHGRFDVVFETKVPVQPQPWNQYIDETRGYICDHRQANGSFFRPPSINAILLYRPSVSNILDTQNLAIDTLNNNANGIEGKRLVATIVNLDWPQSQITAVVLNLTKTISMDVVFGTSLTSETWGKWMKAIEAVKEVTIGFEEPLTYIPPDFRPPCKKNIVYLGMSARQIVQPTLRWLQDQNINGIFFVGEQGSSKSSEVLTYLNSTVRGVLPATSFMGGCNIETANCLNTLRTLFLATSSASRLVVIASVSSQNTLLTTLFDQVSTLQRSRRIFVITTSSIDRSLLTMNMTGHFSVASYFSDISLPQNSVFRSSLQALYGRTFDPSEAMEKIHTAITRIYNRAVQDANTLDSDRVRIRGWATFSTPAGIITVNKNNQLSSTPRIAQVINVGGFLKYRLVYGDLQESLVINPIKGEGVFQDEECYFGPVIEIPSSWDILRIACCVIAAICLAGFALCAGYVCWYRDMLVIRHSGAHFLILTLIGCTINVAYVFVITPVTKTPQLCVAEFWPLHSGFIIVFSGLLQKVYTIFQTTQRKRFLKSQGNAQANFWKQVSAVILVFVLYMVLRTVLQKDDVTFHFEDIIEGVRIKQTTSCSSNIWEWSILGVEVLMIIVGIAMALQVREVPSAYNESFHFGMAIYIWAFVKIINEVFLLFLPFNYQMYFAMKAGGQFIPNVHTAFMFIYPKYLAISQGKGNERIRIVFSSQDSSSMSSSQTQSTTTTRNGRKYNATTTSMTGGTVGVRSIVNGEKAPPVPSVPTAAMASDSESDVEN